MVEQARAQGPVVVVDAGRSLVKADKGVVDPAALDQLREKARVVLRALVASQADAIAVGGPDWALGSAFVRELLAAEGAPVLAANLICAGERPFPATRVVERGGRRIGLIGLTVGEVEGCEVEPSDVALRRAVSELTDVDLRIALLPTEAAGTRKALEGVAGIEFAVDAHATRQGTAELVGATWVVGSGPRGQRVGLADLQWRSGAEGWAAAGHAEQLVAEADRVRRRIESLERRKEQGAEEVIRRSEELIGAARTELAALEAERASWAQTEAGRNLLELRLVELDDTIADAPVVLAEVERVTGAIEAGKVGEAVVVAAERRAPAGSPFAGSASCAPCHGAIDTSWAATPHANAWQTLVDDGHAADHACFSCHATGVGAEGGPASPATVGGLRDVQCEACHGPSMAHVAAPTEHKPARSPEVAVCTTCHDGERDMGQFDLSSYLPRVAHQEARP